MVKNKVTRLLEQTGDWISCQSSTRDRYLLETKAYSPQTNIQNCLKVEIGIKDSLLSTQYLEYELHITIRLVKLIYLDNRSISSIGQSSFYKLPTFDLCVLPSLYQDVPTGTCKNPIPYFKVKNICSKTIEILPTNHLLWGQPYELPCQSLFYALLNYQKIIVNFADTKLYDFSFVHLSNIKKSVPLQEPSVFTNQVETFKDKQIDSKDQPMWNGDEDKPCWGEPDQPFVGFKLATICLKKKLRRGEALQPYEPELNKPVELVSTVKQEDQEMKDENKTPESLPLHLRTTRLNELEKLLKYLYINAASVELFDYNNTRSAYSSFKDSNSTLRDIHSVCHFFIASHLPIDEQTKNKEIGRKSVLKQKDYEIKLQEAELKEKDYFSSEMTRASIKKRQDHLQKILTTPQLSDKQILQMAIPEKEVIQTQQVSVNDYSNIFKKKVKINVVEKQVFQYNLDQEEIEYKKRKGKKHK